jgi:hypothetical protein
LILQNYFEGAEHMAARMIETRGVAPPLVERGYHIVYHDGEPNHCPGCGKAHWYVGRLSAECAFCGTAVPRENAALGGGQFISRSQPFTLPEAA